MVVFGMRGNKMKVLAIGNSFSNDAMRYLHGIAKADGVDTKRLICS